MSIVRSHRRALHLGALVPLIVLGCMPPSTTAGTTTRSAKTYTEIQSAEIDARAVEFRTAYDIVHTLRPSMLVSRERAVERQSPATLWQARRGIKVYLDGIAYGGVESLATIPASTVLEVRWLSALDATTRFGTGNIAGAILVTSLSGRR
jgi:hypothetical protein